MSLANKQLRFRKPKQVSNSISEGIRALAEQHNGRISDANEHCIQCVADLTEATLINLRSKNPPASTRNGQMLVTLIWILLTDGILKTRQHDIAQTWLNTLLTATDLLIDDIDTEHIPLLVDLFSENIALHDHVQAPTRNMIIDVLSPLLTEPTQTTGNRRVLPPHNRVFVGRESNLDELKKRIGVISSDKHKKLTVVRGFPGVGKTAVVNALGRDDIVQKHFSHGLLWARLGIHSDLMATLKSWATQLGARHLIKLHQLSDLREGLRHVLQGLDILLLIDDVWHESDGLYIKNMVDLQHNTVLLTTRFTDVADKLKDLSDDVYVLKSLTEAHSIELLTRLAQEPVKKYASRMPELVKNVEGLPLALRVAGPLLQHYHDLGFDIDELLDEFASDYNRLLDSDAPADRFDETTGRTPTIELLFQRSVETLPFEAQLAFASIGILRHKPATFDRQAMISVWEIKNNNKMIEMIVGRGLLDVTPEQRFRMHQTLHTYANKLIDIYEATGQLL